MTELSFAQSTRRNYTAPILIAVTLLAVAVGAAYRYMAQQTVGAAVTHVAVCPISVKYKQDKSQGFKVLVPTSTEEGLYIIPTLHIDNHLRAPLFLKDIHATVTIHEGELHTSAIEKQDFKAVYTGVTAVQPLNQSPLLRESTIAPGASAEGSVILQFPIKQAVWNTRSSASITIDFYHQSSLTVEIPKP